MVVATAHDIAQPFDMTLQHEKKMAATKSVAQNCNHIPHWSPEAWVTRNYCGSNYIHCPTAKVHSQRFRALLIAFVEKKYFFHTIVSPHCGSGDSSGLGRAWRDALKQTLFGSEFPAIRRFEFSKIEFKMRTNDGLFVCPQSTANKLSSFSLYNAIDWSGNKSSLLFFY